MEQRTVKNREEAVQGEERPQEGDPTAKEKILAEWAEVELPNPHELQEVKEKAFTPYSLFSSCLFQGM